MSIAPNQLALKKRIDTYLWTNKSSEMKALQSLLQAHFLKFSRVAIIGGLVRDFAREGRDGFKSDVDLVIEAPEDTVAELASRLGAKKNVFGGYAYGSGHWKIDFWALETTWARKHVSIQKMEDVISGTFFDWDAVAYDLQKRQLICSDDYLDRMRHRTLEINLLPNPSPLGNLVRAMRRLVLWNVRPGPELRSFIDQHLDEDSLRYVQAKEFELFRSHVSMRWHSPQEAKEALFREPNNLPEQLEIPL
jgi:hypothetical protein